MGALFTPQAELDLEEIGDYIRISEGPLQYAKRPELGETVRTCAHSDYLIAFELFQDDAMILRVLHGMRNVREIFADD
jgi:toxin ParE1/3/4